jgi:hypothetical protein
MARHTLSNAAEILTATASTLIRYVTHIDNITTAAFIKQHRHSNACLPKIISQRVPHLLLQSEKLCMYVQHA